MSLFRRKRHERPPAEEPPAAEETGPPTIDEIASPFFGAGDWTGLTEALNEIDPDGLEDPPGWYTYRGIAAEQQGRRDEAVSAYSEGVRRHPDSSRLQCVMGRLLEEEGRFDEALPHFQAVRLDGGGAAVMTAARYCYLWDALDDAATLYSRIFDAYFALRVADDTFLYIRGLPFFSQAFPAYAAVLVLGGRGDEAKALLERAETELSDLGETEDERLTLEATLGQPDGLLAFLPRQGRSDRWAAVRLATWRARAAEQPAEAQQALASVSLTDDDLPWLEDVLLIAEIAAARRAGDVRDDDPRVDDLLEQRQALLLEPEHAYVFGLLDEQEILKDEYRRRRRELGPPPRRKR